MAAKNNDYIYSVKWLWIPKNTDAEKVAEYFEEFITMIPEISEELKETLFAGKTDRFIVSMETVISLLKDIHATWLTADAEYLWKSAKRNNIEICRKQIAPFVTNLLSLAIEIQMVKSRAENQREENQSKIETYSNIVNNLSAAERLISDGEHSKAYTMISDMALENETDAVQFLNAALRKDHEKAGVLIKALKDNYIQQIVNCGGSENDLKRKILAVDDRPEILTSVSQALKTHYKVLGAPGGQVALKILEKERPELFILDIEMPVMNGYQLAIMIRCMEEYAKTPILFLTSNATKEYVMKAITAGANDFIVKPVNTTTLLAKVSKYLP